MRRAVGLACCAAGFLAGTWFLGWWGVPLVALVCGLWERPRDAALGAVLAWAGLLAFAGASGALLPFASRFGGILSLPGWGMLALTLLLAAGLGWGGAAVVAAVRNKA